MGCGCSKENAVVEGATAPEQRKLAPQGDKPAQQSKHPGDAAESKGLEANANGKRDITVAATEESTEELGAESPRGLHKAKSDEYMDVEDVGYLVAADEARRLGYSEGLARKHKDAGKSNPLLGDEVHADHILRMLAEERYKKYLAELEAARRARQTEFRNTIRELHVRTASTAGTPPPEMADGNSVNRTQTSERTRKQFAEAVAQHKAPDLTKSQLDGAMFMITLRLGLFLRRVMRKDETLSELAARKGALELVIDYVRVRVTQDGEFRLGKPLRDPVRDRFLADMTADAAQWQKTPRKKNRARMLSQLEFMENATVHELRRMHLENNGEGESTHF